VPVPSVEDDDGAATLELLLSWIFMLEASCNHYLYSMGYVATGFPTGCPLVASPLKHLIIHSIGILKMMTWIEMMSRSVTNEEYT